MVFGRVVRVRSAALAKANERINDGLTLLIDARACNLRLVSIYVCILCRNSVEIVSRSGETLMILGASRSCPLTLHSLAQSRWCLKVSQSAYIVIHCKHSAIRIFCCPTIRQYESRNRAPVGFLTTHYNVHMVLHCNTRCTKVCRKYKCSRV